MAILSARSLALLLDAWRDDSAGPAYGALADRIRLLVLDGRIPLDTRLPAERDLAGQLNVSRTTVTAAYSELRDAGYVTSIRGSGSVARLPQPSVRLPDPDTEGYLDFSKASLPAHPAVVDAAARAAEQLPAYLATGAFDPIGMPVLRQAIADHYSARGLPTEVDQVMVTIGAQHAIALLGRTLLDRGDRALVETPSYPHAIEALREAGARLVPVNVSTEAGWDEAALEQAMQRTSPTVAYLMPDFHNPTGQSMSPELREKTVALAAASGTTLIADETMAELAIDDVPVAPSLATFAADASTPVLIGSVGKTLWGGIRIGWIRADRTLIQRLVRNRVAGDMGTPVLEQLLVAELLPRYPEILESRRRHLRAGRDHLVAQLGRRIPEWEVPAPAGGLTAWVNIGEPVSSQLTLACRTEGLILAAGPRFGIDGAFERFMRVPFSYSIEEIDRAVGAMERAWRAVGRHPITDTGYLAAVV